MSPTSIHVGPHQPPFHSRCATTSSPKLGGDGLPCGVVRLVARTAAAALAGLQQRAGTEGGLQAGLLFHCFSGHGAILHALIAAQMHGHGAAHLGRRHIGTIYDSVPARCDSAQLVRGLGSVLGGGAATDARWWRCVRRTTSLAWPYMKG